MLCVGIARYPQCRCTGDVPLRAFQRISYTVWAGARLFLRALAGIVQLKPRPLSGQFFCVPGSAKTMTHRAPATTAAGLLQGKSEPQEF